MASFKQVTLKDPVTGEYLSPRVYGALEYEVVEDGEVTPPYDMNADTLQGHPASYFAPADHNHDDKYAKLNHTHTQDQVDGLTNVLNGKANSNHTHTVSQITDMPDLTNAVPSGIICMWSGKSTAIPSGWHLCDGSSGTPDLRNRFIVGAGSSYSVGNTGGSDSVTLSTSQIPSHTHNIGSHRHTFGAYNMSSGRPSSSGSNVGAYGSLEFGPTSSSGRGGTVTVAAASGNTGSAGSGSSHENRPPYYALCFIMKL